VKRFDRRVTPTDFRPAAGNYSVHSQAEKSEQGNIISPDQKRIPQQQWIKKELISRIFS
jgi:hypothetical protein